MLLFKKGELKMKKESVEKVLTMLKDGKFPKVIFGNEALDIDLPIAQNAMGRIIHMSVEEDMSDDSSTCYCVRVNLEDFYEHNKSVDDKGWKDVNSGEFCLSAEEAGVYPKNHIITFYIDDITDEDKSESFLIKLVDESEDEEINVYDFYLQDHREKQSYMEWLEEMVRFSLQEETE